MLYEKESSSGSIVFPVLLISIALTGLLSMQTWLLFSEHGALGDTYTKQTEILGNIEKAKTQVNNLIKGTVALAKQDNKHAMNVIEELKKAGMNFQDAPAPKAPAPAAEPAPAAPAPAAVAPAAPPKPATPPKR
jgi:hypothetical protein